MNFVTFLILWKIGKFEEAKRYIEINHKLIEVLLDEDKNRKSESQLSVILEQSHHHINGKLSSINRVNESIDMGEDSTYSYAG